MSRLNWSKDEQRRAARGAAESASGAMNEAALVGVYGHRGPRRGPSKEQQRAEAARAAEQFEPRIIGSIGTQLLARALEQAKERARKIEQTGTPIADAIPIAVQVARARAALADTTTATAFTDGACEPNPGPGGWGVLIITGGLPVELYCGAPKTTNNRMEIAAAIAAIAVLPAACLTTIVSDSQYVVKGARDWLPGWRAKGFRRAGLDMPNADLWRRLDEGMKGRRITWEWTRGHAGNAYNERADELATLGMRSPT